MNVAAQTTECSKHQVQMWKTIGDQCDCLCSRHEKLSISRTKPGRPETEAVAAHKVWKNRRALELADQKKGFRPKITVHIRP